MAETLKSLMKKQALIKMSAENQVPILCRDVKQRKVFRGLATELGLTIPDPICLHELVSKIQKDEEYGREAKDMDVLINDTDYVLREGLEKYGFEHVTLYPTCDIDKPIDQCTQRTYTVYEFIDKVEYDYTGVKVMDLSTKTELLSIDGDVTSNDMIPEDIGNTIVTNINITKNGCVIINIGKESQGE